MESYCYHGIGESILKYESIMKNGIVSTQMSKGIEAYNKNGGVNYNGDDRISVVIPHDTNQWGALNIYILSGIAFKIKDCEYTLSSETQNASEYFDEAFINKEIPREKIVGIIINSETMMKRIKDLSLIGAPANNQVIANVLNIIKQLENQGVDKERFSYIGSLIEEYESIFNNDNLEFLEKDKQLAVIKNKMNAILAKIVEEIFEKKCEKKDVNIMDVISLYNDRNLPIYNEKDIAKECEQKNVSNALSLEDAQEDEYTCDNTISESIIRGDFVDKTVGIRRVIDMIRKKFREKNLIQKEDKER